MHQLLSRQSLIVLTTGLLVAFATSDAQAQRGRLQQGNEQGGGQAGGQTGGQDGGIGAVGANDGPSGAVTGEISRSSDRVLSEVSEQAGTARGGMPGGMGGMRGMGGMGMGMGGFGGMSPFGASPFGNQNAADQTPPVRVRLRGAIERPARSPQLISSRIERRVTASTPMARRVNGFSVSVVDGVATISGTASSERDRRMAELVLRLEPGVRQVNNQVVVAP